MATEQKESAFPVTPWNESELASRPPERPSILKTPASLLEPRKSQPAKTLRFQAQPDRTGAQVKPQPGCSSKADEMLTVDSDSSDGSETSLSRAAPSFSRNANDSNNPKSPSPRPLRSQASSAPDAGSKAKVSSWFPKRMRRYFAALTRDKEDGQGKGKNSQNTNSQATNRQNTNRRSNHPRHRRRTGVATERYTGPQSQDDMRWRVALSRYALLTLLGSLTFVCLVVATLHFAGTSGDALDDKQQAQDDGRRPAAWRALRTSVQSNALPGYEGMIKKGSEAQPEIAAMAATKSMELAPSIGETPVIGRDGEQEEEHASMDDAGTSSVGPVRRKRES